MDFDLEETLKSKNEQLYNCLQPVKNFCSEVWKDRLLPWFTNHDCEHSKEIVHILGQILGPIKDTPQFLNEHELFVLLVSAYLHDIGMQCLKVDSKAIETLTEDDYNFIRKEHAAKSADIIVKKVANVIKRDDFHIPDCIDEEYIPIIASVSKGHSTDFFTEIVEQFKKDPRSAKGRKVRGELLTALLLIADELDLQCKRVKFYETAKFELSTYSQIHWFKHHYVERIEVDGGKINIVMRLPIGSDNYKELIRELIETKLIEQIHEIMPIFRETTSGFLNMNDQITFDFRVEKTTAKRVLPEHVILEIKKALKKELPIDPTVGTNIPPTIASIFPKPSGLFTGREDELKRFEKAISTASFISIEGLGGIGKTEFAAKCIEKYFTPDKVVWFECLPDSKLDAVIETAGYPDVLKGENKTERAKFSGFRDLLERDGKAIFLDNFHDVLDPSFKEFFQMSKQYLKQAKIILITRERPDMGLLIAPVEIEGLKADALNYAKKLIETFYADLVVDDEILYKICINVAGHPLATNLALQLLHYGESPEQIIQKIIEAPDKSMELSHRLLDEIFSHPKSTADEKNLMLSFSVFRSETAKEAISFVSNIGDIAPVLRRLQDKKMISRTGSLYGTHPLVREFCYQRLEDKKAAHWKAAECFKAQRKEQFVPLLEEEQFYHLFAGEYYEQAADLVCQMGEDFVRMGHTNTLKEMIKEVSSKGINRSRFYVFLGDISTIRGEWVEATSYYEQAFLFDGVDEKTMAHAYIKLGEILYGKGNVKEALKCYEDAYDICLKGGYKKEEAMCLNNIGLVSETFGNLLFAETKLTDALHIRREINDKQGIATTLLNIGKILRIRGELDEALDKYDDSLKIFIEIGDKQGSAIALSNIGFILYKRGELDYALDKYSESLKIRQEIGHKQGIAASLSSLGDILKTRGELDDALEKYRESLKISQEIGDKQSIAIFFVKHWWHSTNKRRVR